MNKSVRFISSATSLWLGFLLMIVGGISASTAIAQDQPVYNSIPKAVPQSVVSEGPEAYAFEELGDGFSLAANTGTLGKVKVVLESWACQSGRWYTGDCVTSPGATFSQPITVNLYSVKQASSAVYGEEVPTPDVLLGTLTETFQIPYRPTSTPDLCGGNNQVWFSKKDNTCYHGISDEISVNFSGLHIPVPGNGELIVTVAYNTTHYGPYPIGESAPCYSTSAGCPYDSLNISVDGSGPSGLEGGVGTVLVNDGIFVNYTLSANACPGNTLTGQLALDAPNPLGSNYCDGDGWDGYHPEIEVRANTNTKHSSKADEP